MRKYGYGRGWFNHPVEHGLAARGIKTKTGALFDILSEQELMGLQRFRTLDVGAPVVFRYGKDFFIGRVTSIKDSNFTIKTLEHKRFTVPKKNVRLLAKGRIKGWKRSMHARPTTKMVWDSIGGESIAIDYVPSSNIPYKIIVNDVTRIDSSGALVGMDSTGTLERAKRIVSHYMRTHPE